MSQKCATIREFTIQMLKLPRYNCMWHAVIQVYIPVYWCTLKSAVWNIVVQTLWIILQNSWPDFSLKKLNTWLLPDSAPYLTFYIYHCTKIVPISCRKSRLNWSLIYSYLHFVRIYKIKASMLKIPINGWLRYMFQWSYQWKFQNTCTYLEKR